MEIMGVRSREYMGETELLTPYICRWVLVSWQPCELTESRLCGRYDIVHVGCLDLIPTTSRDQGVKRRALPHTYVHMCWCMHIPDSCQSTTSPVSDAYVLHSGYQVGQAIGVDTYVNISVMSGTHNM